MIDYDKFADLLIEYSLEVKEKENILVNSEITALPLIEKIYEKILSKNAYPIINFSPSFDEIFFKYASDEQLINPTIFEKFQAENIDKRLTIRSSLNPKRLSNIEPEKIQKRLKATKLLTSYMYKKRWSLTLFPTIGYAIEAEMSLNDFNSFFSKALFLNCDNPINSWNELHDKQQKIINLIGNKKNIHIKSKNVDLKFNVENRKWINSDGKTNMPSGEIYTSPHVKSFNGFYKSSFPSTKYGKEIDGIYLEFKDGKLIKANAKKNEKYFLKLLETDEGSKQIGEFGIGLNYNIQKSIKNILFDEKIGGTVHIALGNSYPNAGGKNKSAIHLDIITDLRNDGEIYFDNELLYKNGKFLIEM